MRGNVLLIPHKVQSSFRYWVMFLIVVHGNSVGMFGVFFQLSIQRMEGGALQYTFPLEKDLFQLKSRNENLQIRSRLILNFMAGMTCILVKSSVGICPVKNSSTSDRDSFPIRYTW